MHGKNKTYQSKQRPFIALVIFFLGVLIFFYPYIAQQINNINATKIVANYEQQMSNPGSSNAAYADEDIFGSIFIPKLNLELPIYVGSVDANLSRGIAHLEGTSLPIGGVNTHAVLAGHNGAVTNEWFTNIDQLKQGDLFYIRHDGLTLTYEVISTEIIAPSDTSTLLIREGEDLVTLLTCTSTGAERLIVTGSRVLD